MSESRNKFILLKDHLALLRIGLGIVFVLAALHRIIFFDIAYYNFVDLGLNPANLWVTITIIIEFTAGTLLILNRHISKASLTLAIMVAIGIIVAVLKAGQTLIQNMHEVFMVTATPTDIVLHMSYVVGLITLYLYSKKKIKSSG